MTNSRENLQTTLNHQEPDRMVVDFGASPVTGIHVHLVEQLREHFGLEQKSVKVNEPYQMLGEVEEDLQEAMGVDVIGVSPPSDMFGIHHGIRWYWYPALLLYWWMGMVIPCSTRRGMIR